MYNSYFTIFYLIYRDYHVAFFISDSLSALGPDISVKEPIDSRTDIRTMGWCAKRLCYDLSIVCLAQEDIFGNRRITM
jgi:hypothetical protein